jgi:WD40 repeat protein
MSQCSTIEQAPLQTYSSALIFSPSKCTTRTLFRHEEPVFVNPKPQVEDGWGALLQTLEGHSDSVESVAFSPQGDRIVSGSDDNTVRIWDTATGTLQQTLEGHSGSVRSVAASLSNASSFVDQSSYLNVGGRWVMSKGKRVLLLPENRQATTMAVHGNRLVIGSRSGIVTILGIISESIN